MDKDRDIEQMVKHELQDAEWDYVNGIESGKQQAILEIFRETTSHSGNM